MVIVIVMAFITVIVNETRALAVVKASDATIAVIAIVATRANITFGSFLDYCDFFFYCGF
jgi:hypothetical protein